MVSDQEIAKGVETVLRQSDPSTVSSLNGVVQQLEAKLGLDLSHKAGFIRDHINRLFHPPPPLPTTTATPAASSANPTQPLQPQALHLSQKDHFALQQQHHAQFQQFPPHFALHHPHQHPHHQQPQVFSQHLNFRQPPAPQHAPAQPQQPLPPPQATKPQPFSQNAASAAAPIPKESAPTGAKRRGGPGGLNKVCGVSNQLQVVVGEPALPRTEIVKQLWAYIRKNNLQDPSNKRKIICDDALRAVFETDCTDMFKMNKLLAKHIIPLEPTKDSSQSKRAKVDVESRTESTEPGQSLVVISEALAKFLGPVGSEMTQMDIFGRVSEYIKVNQLEDPLNPMVIRCDAKLQELFGCESISAVGVKEMLAHHHLLKR